MPQRWGRGVSVPGTSDTRRNRTLTKGKVGKCRGGLESAFQRSLFLCVANLVNRSFVDTEVTQPTPSTPVPTAGVAVGNRGETLGRRGGEQQGTQRPEEEEISRGKKTD